MLKFGLIYKEISFELELIPELNHSTYSLTVYSKKDEIEQTHYISNIILMGQDEELLSDLEKYLEDESIIEDLVKHFEEIAIESNLPLWARNKKGS